MFNGTSLEDLGQKASNTSGLLALFATTWFVSSFSFQFGFFRMVDPRLISVVTLNDVVTIAIAYLPMGILLSFLGLGVGAFFGMRYRSSETVQQELNLLTKLVLALSIPLVVLGALNVFVSRSWLFWLVNTLGSLSIVYWLIGSRLSREVHLLAAGVWIFGVLVIFPAYQGELEARRLLASPKPNAILVFAVKRLEGTVVFMGSETIVFRNDPRTVSIYPRSSVEEIVWFDVPVPRHPTEDSFGSLYRYLKSESPSFTKK